MLESIEQSIIAADNGAIVIAILMLSILCVMSLFGIFYYFYRGRMISDTPTSKIRSAHQGFVELEGQGRLMKGAPIISPVSGTQCLWYQYRVERRTHGNRVLSNSHHSEQSSWETISSGSSDALFLLFDGTGLCVLDPEDATITPSFSKTWYSAQPFESIAIQDAQNRAGHSSWFLSFDFLGNKNYRYTEKRIDINAELYVLGEFKTVGGSRNVDDKKAEIRDLLAKWKKRPNFLLAKFDENNDGQIDVQEWQSVMAFAEQQVKKNQAERRIQPEIHTLFKPEDNRQPYIISVESQQSILNRYHRYSWGSLASFFISGLSLVWVIGLRFN